MRHLLSGMLTALIALPACAQAPAIKVDKTAGGRFDLTVDVHDQAEASALQGTLEARAKSQCGDKPYWLGQYRFEAVKQVSGPAAAAKPMRFVQQAGCGDRPDEWAGRVVTPAFDAVSGDDAKVIGATENWFRQLADGDYRRAYGVMSPLMEPASFEQWQQPVAAAAATAGRIGELRIVKVTWYDNPEGADPGLYAAADVQNSYEGVAAQCGYLMWYKAPGADGFILGRSELGNILRSDAAKMTAAELAAIAAEMRCPLPIASR